MTAAALRPPFAYFGGKTTIARRIVSLLPAHGHYVEPFAGGLAALLAKPRSRIETVNDLDQDLVTCWRVLRDRGDELVRVCALTPHSRAEHAMSHDLPDGDDVERARRVWVRLSQGRGGMPRVSGWRHYVRPASRGSSMGTTIAEYVDRMGRIVGRLAGVSIKCRPALELIAAYGAQPDVCLYLDPPYLGSSRRTTSRCTGGRRAMSSRMCNWRPCCESAERRWSCRVTRQPCMTSCSRAGIG